MTVNGRTTPRLDGSRSHRELEVTITEGRRAARTWTARAVRTRIARAVPVGIDGPVKVERIVSVSGGKDSTALYLLALERGVEFEAVFADTGHEHPWTYEAVETLAERAGGPPIRTVRADLAPRFARRRRNIEERWPEEGVSAAVVRRALEVMHPTGNPFLDLCLLRGGFPSVHMRYCTEELKIVPIRDQAYRPVWDRGNAVESWQGLRREESAARMRLAEREPYRGRKADGPGELYRPLLDWTVDDVWAMHAKHGIERNRLYDLGVNRVGCAPCVMARKGEIRMFATRFPEVVDRVREWERLVGRGSKREVPVATLFNGRHLGGGEITTETHGIDAQVAWSKTSRGGTQYDLDFEVAETFGPCSHIGACG